jgi:sulfhydrogenase subunit gamma (sulfur reductase)
MEMQNIYLPQISDLVKVEKLTEQETFFEVKLPKGRDLGHQPGQFVQVSLYGIGEAPISICSSPLKKGTFEMVVRRVGNVTAAMHAMKAGDKLGIRGPFGKGFPVDSYEGKDMIIVAGGIGLPPLRSLINTLIDPKQRKRFGRLIILYGARKDIEYRVTVDRPAPGWTGHVGVITTLVPDLSLDLKKTEAVIVGPPIMYKFAILALRSKGLRDEQIWVSLERKMKCGVGKCGHCQINNIYVCQEGPVFNYGKIKDLKEAIS